MAWGARNLISTQDFERAARSLGVVNCVEINQCVGCTRQFFTKIFFSATTRPTWLGRAARKRHRHAIILISTQVVNQKNVLWDHLSCRDLCGNQIYGAFVTLHAIDATPARWRGDAGSSPLDRARTAAPSPRGDLVKNCPVHRTHWLISTQASTAVLAYSIYMTWKSYRSITNMFHFNEDDAVSFDDLLDATQTLIPKGAAAARESVVERRGFAASGDGMGSPHPSATRLNAGAEVV